MFFGILTLITALAIAGVAAWFSIAGLMAIFSAAALPIAVMAGTLEVGKLLTASWLYQVLERNTYCYLNIFVYCGGNSNAYNFNGYLWISK